MVVSALLVCWNSRPDPATRDEGLGADRELAQTAIDDAGAANGSPRRIAEANRGQARGDSAVAEAWYSRGIRHYREAWDDPQDALHR